MSLYRAATIGAGGLLCYYMAPVTILGKIATTALGVLGCDIVSTIASSSKKMYSNWGHLKSYSLRPKPNIQKEAFLRAVERVKQLPAYNVWKEKKKLNSDAEALSVLKSYASSGTCIAQTLEILNALAENPDIPSEKLLGQLSVENIFYYQMIRDMVPDLAGTEVFDSVVEECSFHHPKFKYPLKLKAAASIDDYQKNLESLIRDAQASSPHSTLVANVVITTKSWRGGDGHSIALQCNGKLRLYDSYGIDDGVCEYSNLTDLMKALKKQIIADMGEDCLFHFELHAVPKSS